MLWSVSAIGLIVLLASVAKKRFQHNADACTRRPNDDSPCSLIVVLGCPPAAISGSVNRYFLGRVHATLQLAAEIPSARVLCTGGVDARGVDEADGVPRAQRGQPGAALAQARACATRTAATCTAALRDSPRMRGQEGSDQIAARDGLRERAVASIL